MNLVTEWFCQGTNGYLSYDLIVCYSQSCDEKDNGDEKEKVLGDSCDDCEVFHRVSLFEKTIVLVCGVGVSALLPVALIIGVIA